MFRRSRSWSRWRCLLPQFVLTHEPTHGETSRVTSMEQRSAIGVRNVQYGISVLPCSENILESETPKFRWQNDRHSCDGWISSLQKIMLDAAWAHLLQKCAIPVKTNCVYFSVDIVTLLSLRQFSDHAFSVSSQRNAREKSLRTKYEESNCWDFV